MLTSWCTCLAFILLAYPFWYLSLIGPSATWCLVSVILLPISNCSLLQWVKSNSRFQTINSLLKLEVKQIPLPYCLHAFVVKDNPQPGSPSMHTHLVTACFPCFPTTAELVGCSSEAQPDWRGRHTILLFLNCKTVCKIVKLFIKFSAIWYITNKHRCHPLFFRKGSSKFVTCKQSPTEQAWQSELGHRIVLVSQLGTMLRDLPHAAFHAA